MTRDACFYDGRCGLCRRTTRFLRAIDLFRRLDFIDMSTVPVGSIPFAAEALRAGPGEHRSPEAAIGATADPAALLSGMPMRTRDGRQLIGFPAVRRALAQTPLAPLAWLLYLPGISHIAAAYYRHIATPRNRDCAIAGGRRGANPAARGTDQGSAGTVRSTGSVRLPPSGPQRILRP